LTDSKAELISAIKSKEAFSIDGTVTKDGKAYRINEYYDFSTASKFDVAAWAYKAELLTEAEKIDCYCDLIIERNFENIYCLESIHSEIVEYQSNTELSSEVTNKINSAHAFGGIKLCKKTIEDTLGVRVDKYIMVHDDAVKDVVNVLGGIPIYVEKRMNYDDYAGKLHIHLEKGLNVLDGTQAVGYLRFRHDGLGDIGRTQRQQWFLKGFIDKVKTPQALAKLPELLSVVKDDIKTDMSVYELSQLANVARGLSDGGVQIATLPGAPNQHGYISYWILDPEKTQETINRLIYREETSVDTDVKLTAGIMYVPSKLTEANELKAQFEAMGYKVNCLEASGLPHSQFLAHNKNVSNSFYNYIRKRIPSMEKIQYVYDPLKNYSVSSDFTVILAN